MDLPETMSPGAEVGTQATEAPDLRALVESKNIAEDMQEQELTELGKHCAEGFEDDLSSREDWEEELGEWTKLALQVKEEKTFPWVGASNVKYPLLSIASMQFNARAYPALVPATSDVVKVEVIGQDPDGQKLEKAKRIGTYMSYQVLNQMEGWEEDMDKLLIMLPIIGTVFKKTYYNSVLQQNVSELILPKNLVVNYWAKNLECAERVSEIIPMNKRVLKEKMMSQIYLDVDLGDPVVETDSDGKPPPAVDETTPYTIIEQHCYWDMDGDDYAEPYIVTFERHSGKVLRVVARFDDKGIKHITTSEGKEKLAKIDAIQYYTKFSFIPNPEGGFYDIGFGRLLGPLNESVNTLINQLTDSGTINNLNGGFLGKGLKLKMGQSSWQPGEWKSVQSTAEDLRKQIVPLPSKEPSKVLFELLTSLISGAKELASVAEIFVGKMPGQNTPATTTMATIEQGMKVFTAVYKRVYRSLRSEFKKIFALNGTYLDEAKYASVVDGPVTAADFDDSSYDVCPGADPNTATATEKLMKAQGLMELLPTGILDPVKVVARVLEAQEQPSYQELFSQAVQETGQPPPPPPDPKILALQAKKEADEKKAQMDMMQTQHKMELEERSQQVEMMMKAQDHKMDQRHELMMGMLKAKSVMAQTDARMASGAAETGQKMQQTEASHQQNMSHQKEKQALQRKQQASKPSSKTGKPSR
jgi:chaperonin GroES